MRRKSCLKAITVFGILVTALVLAPSLWAAPKYRVLYNFQGGKNGAGPEGALVSDGAGDFYGVTAGGGDGCGTVFELKRVKDGWAEERLYIFPGNAKDGCLPSTNLALDAKGNLFGTTYAGGQGNCFGRKCGTVFELSPVGGGKWKEAVLHRFAGGNDGEIPSAGVVLDAAGNIYGTTEDGGGTSCNCGTVFELMPSAGGARQEKVLHSFSGTDGASPSGLIFDMSGNLYGVTIIGGVYDVGVVFELSPTSGGGWNESVIYNFSSDGEAPANGLTLKGHNLYGATTHGGAGNWGTIFELKGTSNGGWAHSVLYAFSGGKDGRYPNGQLVFDKAGNLYGSTSGDVTCTKGYRWACGNLFELMPQSGGHWKLEVLHTFPGGTAGAGAFPSEPVFDGERNLYGVATEGGDGKCADGWGCGVVFEVTP